MPWETIVVSKPRMWEVPSKQLKGGLCWQDLIVEPMENYRWVDIKTVKRYMEHRNKTLNYDVHFVLRNVGVGVFHLELTDDESEWTPPDIMRLPDWVYLGGGFYDAVVDEGYSYELADYINYFVAEDSVSTHSGSSTKSTDKQGAVRKAIEECAEQKLTGDQALDRIRNAMITTRPEEIKLSRVEMELIARLTQRFCYSACVASAEQFVDDVQANFFTGDTLETVKRMINCSLKKAQIKEHKQYYYDDNHISRYNFPDANVITGALLVKCLMKTTNCNTEDDAGELRRWMEEYPECKAVCLDLALRFKLPFKLDPMATTPTETSTDLDSTGTSPPESTIGSCA
ncbi:hypothetical protein VNI00_017089 [Paramarasmius palmivorus]|uniref:Uncharacterized protein n=1 Tax=Paramarasmius palmivorus TaxID=297713 RepID=A0AAW0B746_9AGAR